MSSFQLPTTKGGTLSRKSKAPTMNEPTGKEIRNALKEGWITKQGNYIKNWRPRWCQLFDGILVYYKEPTVEPVPTNFFMLAGCSVGPYEKVGPGCFELVMANGERRYMQAQSKVERDEWIKAIRDAGNKRPLSVAFGDSVTKSVSVASITDLPGSIKPFDKLKPDDFNFLKVLGKGNYGKVMLSTLKEGDGRYYAVKVIKKTSLIDEESLEHVLSENRVLQTLDHPFLVRLYCSFQTEDRLYFVMEFVAGGELFFHIGREKKFSEDRVRFYSAEILCALHYLHSKGVVYRDLKLENLLLDEDGHIKITDFGLVKEGIGYEDTTSTFCGTPEYLAPEILEEENYGRSVDWWALGVVMYELLCGRPPFGATSNMEKLFANILNQPINFPPSLSPEARLMLENLLERDYTKRIGHGPKDGEEVMAHPFFAAINFTKLMKKELEPPFKPQVKTPTDVGNFDKEFTNLPPVLTPIMENEHFKTASDVKDIKLQDFSFVGDPSFLSKKTQQHE